MPNREPLFRLIVGGTITALYALSLIVGFFVPEYTQPPGLHSIMLVVAGGLFVSDAVSSVRGKKEP